MAKQHSNLPELEPLTRIQILVAMGSTAVILLVIAKLWLQFGRVDLLAVAWDGVAILIGLGLGLAVTLASSLVYQVWGAYRQSADYYLALVLKPLTLPDLVWLGLLPGLSEELLFRGVMLSALGLSPIAVLLSSLCFGVLHLSGRQQWPYAVWATVIGLVFGFSAIVTGNLLVPVLAHISTNWLSGYFWKRSQLLEERR
ncbi:CPBP family intramembrane metalloprotease [Trichothermofontia sichuanensis B231]|uniref:CPBP family intramembrane glutamic endopeptidase n=1 Tax=Trichothermofontia sichuanensis TaxID=3045816 RepID=UPI002246D979|nr:type II CAAX endopeptidase family protein [Trichothermofontia sichuanensis]UZQ54987.1 CPBP family intramembrane metalloprotease [Trichothermofontia sichuanensis B231]